MIASISNAMVWEIKTIVSGIDVILASVSLTLISGTHLFYCRPVARSVDVTARKC